MMQQSILKKLQKISRVVADTGDFEFIKKYQPVDATTNPSLILKAVKSDKYIHLAKEAVQRVKKQNPNFSQENFIKEALIEIIVTFGIKIIGVIDGKVSSEVDARVSFNTIETIAYAKKIIAKYEQNNIPRDRVLIKIAATWEGIQAAKFLHQEGINSNLTLIFDKVQAQACAEAKVYLISPFVGRTTDWQIKENNLLEFPNINEDDGVKLVKDIHFLYSDCGFETIVMAASFRNINQIIALAGCDAMTISPILLETLANKYENLNVKLTNNKTNIINQLSLSSITETSFRLHLNENLMATYKLAEGIKLFIKDTLELENLLTTL